MKDSEKQGPNGISPLLWMLLSVWALLISAATAQAVCSPDHHVDVVWVVSSPPDFIPLLQRFTLNTKGINLRQGLVEFGAIPTRHLALVPSAVFIDALKQATITEQVDLATALHMASTLMEKSNTPNQFILLLTADQPPPSTPLAVTTITLDSFTKLHPMTFVCSLLAPTLDGQHHAASINSTSGNEESNNDNNTLIIALVAVIVILVVACAIVLCCWREMRKRERALLQTRSGIGSSTNDIGLSPASPVVFTTTQRGSDFFADDMSEFTVTAADVWEEMVDRESNTTYWVNQRTNEYMWTQPTTDNNSRYSLLESDGEDGRFHTKSSFSVVDLEVWKRDKKHEFDGTLYFIHDAQAGITGLVIGQEEEDKAVANFPSAFVSRSRVATNGGGGGRIGSSSRAESSGGATTNGDAYSDMSSINPLFAGGRKSVYDIEAMEEQLYRELEEEEKAAAAVTPSKSIFRKPSHKSVTKKTPNEVVTTPRKSVVVFQAYQYDDNSFEEEEKTVFEKENSALSSKDSAESRDFRIVKLGQSTKQRFTFTKKKHAADHAVSAELLGVEGRVQAMRAIFERNGAADKTGRKLSFRHAAPS